MIIIGEEYEALTEELEGVTQRIREITDEIRRRRREIDEIYDKEEVEASDLSEADELYDEIDELSNEREELEDRQRELERDIEEIRRNNEHEEAEEVHETHDTVRTFRPVRSTFRFVGRTVKAAAVGTAKKAAKKANPLDKKINMKETADTGVESLRLEYRTVKRGVQAEKSARRAIKIIVTTPKRAVRTVRAVIQITRTVVIHAAALVINPMVWLFVVILVLVYFWVLPIVFFVGAAIVSNNRTKSYPAARGMDITTEYPEAEDFYQIARDAKKSDYEAMFDAMYYNAADLRTSDLVYMVRNDPYQVFDKNYATDDYKNQLKGAWLDTFMPPAEAIAIAYVWLEKQQNDINGTEGQIYSVDFTQDTFDQLVDMMVNWSETDYSGQECPGCDCSVHTEYIPNPLRAELYDKVNTTAQAYNDWNDVVPYLEQHDAIRDGNAQAQYWNQQVLWRVNNWIIVYNENPTFTNGGRDFLNQLGQRYENYVYQYDRTPETIVQQTTTCDHQHTLHSIGLNLNPRDSVLTALNFTDLDKQWVEMVYQGFLRNTDLVTVH